MNRARGQTQRLLRLLFLVIGGFILIGLLTFQMEFIRRTVQHSGFFYRTVATCVPLILMGLDAPPATASVRRSSPRFYTVEMMLLVWLFPLVPATPKLGPVYQQVTHLIPPGFPLLLIAPALVMDLMAARLATRPLRLQSMVQAACFLLIFSLVQWPFAEFLLSPASRTWVFGTHYVSYSSRSFSPEVRNVFSIWMASSDWSASLGWRCSPC